jgi:Endonuclease/Exonuclease/phosphatase family
MKRYFILTIFLLFVFASIPLLAQKKYNDTLFVASWNLENLFDTLHDTNKRDIEFTPNAPKHWTKKRMEIKLQHLARVINDMNDGRGPDLLGTCEVEHKYILEKMIKEYFKNKDYQVAYRESPDERGIDNGLIYNTRKFKLISVYGDTIHITNGDPTRLILNANLVYNNKDTLHVFVNHWPARIGGTSKTEPERIEAANTLKEEVEKIASPKIKIMIIGDFNDDPNNISILRTLDAKPFICSDKSQVDKINFHKFSLFNLAYESAKEGLGTYRYRKNWNMLDQLIVSDNLIDGDIQYVCNSFHIFKPNYLVEHSGYYTGTALPTYGGNKYIGGYSDHFPITAKFIIRN